MNHVTIFK